MSAASVQTSEVPALVLGTGITALGVIRSLGRAGIQAYCASSELAYVASSRWCRRPPTSLDRYAALAPFLDHLPYERAVLFACSDDWVMAASRLNGEVAERFPISQAPSAALATCLDKGRFAGVLQDRDICHPRTTMLESEDQLAEACTGEVGDYFLKPRDSQAFSARYRVKAFYVTSPAEALDRYRQISRDGLQVMLQEYVPGPPTNHYFIDGFVDRNGRVCARFARQRVRMYPMRFGNSSYMTTVPLEHVHPAAKTLDRLLTTLDYRGIFSAEFKFDPRDETFKILEVNVRPWWYIEFAEQCGVNVCRMAHQDALGVEVEPIDRYDVGAHCVFPWLDLGTSLRLIRKGELNFFSWLKSWLQARQALFQWRDPLPSIVFLAGQVREKLAASFSANQNH